jgi:ABC-type Fe3+/spermidine/putrescine transport system ATPase subunit
MAHIVLEGITKSYGAARVLDRCTLKVEKGQVMTLLGPSGCGKTTLLRTLAGFVAPEEGRVLLNGEDITGAAPNRRSVGYVFQNYALFPHLTVAGNVAYGLKVRRRPKAEIAERVARALELVSLGALGDRYPAQLSGGQQQRVAIARVLVLEPDVLLLDEPFNALDAKLRLTMQVELRKLIDRLGITSIFVTHDQGEAMMLSDQVAVMRAGVIEQASPPLALYDQPRNAYVASFIGRANIIDVTFDKGRTALFPELALDTPDGPGRLMVRPENLELGPPDSGLAGSVLFASAMGPTIDYEIDIGAGEPLRLSVNRRAGETPAASGARVGVRIIDPAACRALTGDAS